MWAEFFSTEHLVQLLFSVLRMSTPLIYASLAALISAHAGMSNMALEGIMLTSAFSAVIVSAWTQSALIGLLGAMLFGMLFTLILAFLHIRKQADLIIAGLAMNMLGSGLTTFLLFVFTGDKGSSRMLQSKIMPRLDLPGLANVPILGSIFSGHNLLTYLTIIVALLCYILIFRSRFGLRLRAVGHNPDAAKSVGIKVDKVKYKAMMISGIVASIGGAFMSMGYLSYFARDMVAGRGYIGLAAATLAMGSVGGSVLASLGFGMASAVSTTLSTFNMKAEIVGMIPYLATIVGLVAMSIQKHRKALKKKKLSSQK